MSIDRKKSVFICALAAVLALAVAVVLYARPTTSGDARHSVQAGEEPSTVRESDVDDEPDADDGDAPQEYSWEGSEQEPPAQAVAYTWEPETEEAAEPARSYAIPEGASYEPDVALVSVAEGATLEQVNELLASTDAVATKRVTQEELDSGLLRLELAEGADVETTVNALLVDEAIDVAQPNFYYTMQLGDEADFRALLEEEVAPEPDGLGAAADEAPAGEEPGDTQLEEEPDGVEAQSSEAPSDAEAVEGLESEETAATEPSEESPEADSEEEPSETTLEAQDITDDILMLVNDPLALPGSDTSWGLTSIHAYEAWTLARCEGTVGVAVFDWYPSYEHEDLVDSVVDSYDATQAEGDATYAKTKFTAHGTHVAGIVGATPNNGIGVTGVSYGANLLLINVFENNQSSSESLIRAYDHVASKAEEFNVRVVNISVGGKLENPIGDTLLVRRINKAYEEGVITVAAAGNAKAGTPVPYYEYPGDATNVVSVMNLTRHSSGALVRNDSSNYNVAGQTGKNISAPGTGIYSTYTSGNPPYASVSGTSMASPHAAGVLALEYAANPDLSVEEAVRVLYASALDLGDEGWDEDFGYGEVDAFKAVSVASDPEAVAEIMGDETYRPEVEVPMPTISGATRMPVGATAAYKVTDGSLRIKSGAECAELMGVTLRALEPGTVTLSVLDASGQERLTWDVKVYELEGYWTIGSARDSSLVIGVKAGSVYDRATLTMQKASGNRHQVWRFDEQVDGTYVLTNAQTGKCAHIWNGSSRSGSTVMQYPFEDTEWQHWYLEVDGGNNLIICNSNSELALGIAGGTAKAAAVVQQMNYKGIATQKWQLRKVNIDIGPIWEGVYRISSSSNRRLVLEVEKSSKKNGANVRLGRYAKAKNQKWLFTYLGHNLYRVRPLSSGKVLTVKGNKTKVGTNVVQSRWVSGKGQVWKVVANKDGSYSLRRGNKKLALAAAKSKVAKGTNVIQAKLRPRAKAQKWILTQF